MPRRPLAHADAEPTGGITSIEMARAQLFDVDVNRKKRIDDAIDYFGATQHAPTAQDDGGRPRSNSRPADVH